MTTAADGYVLLILAAYLIGLGILDDAMRRGARFSLLHLIGLGTLCAVSTVALILLAGIVR